MKKIILIILIGMLGLVGCSQTKTMESGEYHKITGQEAKKMMDENEEEIILDVRSLEEYNEGHIEGAVLLPDYEVKEKAEAVLEDKDQVILVYCRSGRRSEGAARELAQMGYTKVYDFGGIMDWKGEVVE